MTDVQEIREMLEGGMSVASVAEEVGLSKSRIYRIAHALGISVNITGRGRAAQLTDEQIDEIIEAYNADENVSNLLMRFDLSYNALYKLLREHGVNYREVKHDWHQERALRLDRAVDLYVKGIPVLQIEIETGIRQPVLNRELKIRGLETRREAKRRTIAPMLGSIAGEDEFIADADERRRKLRALIDEMDDLTEREKAELLLPEDDPPSPPGVRVEWVDHD